MSSGGDGVAEGHVGPFVTFVEHRRPDGVVARWESRRSRKHLGAAPAGGSTWWAPRARGWWIAVLFAVGSILFALGTLPAYSAAVGPRWDSATYFVGSLFFTAAAFLTYREAVDATAQVPSVTSQGPDAVGQVSGGSEQVPGGFAQGTGGSVQLPGGAVPGAVRRKFFVFQPGRIDWWATAVQLVGTLFFNISCGNAMRLGLTAQAASQHVWRPDAFGSICFLVASALAWFEVCHGWFGWRPRSWAWWITLANLTGSLAFGVSAVAAYINPVTGEVKNMDWSAWGTLVGAVCFLVGALLLLPERTEDPESTERESTAPSS